MGSCFDKEVPYIVPDCNNVCYAQKKIFRKFGLFKKTKIGVRVKILFQKNYCYKIFQGCPAYLHSPAEVALSAE